jgi:HK97 family phage portal protein
MDSLRALLPQERKADAIAAAVPSWEAGRPQQQTWSYERSAREGYRLDEYVFACVDFRQNAWGEAPFCAYTVGEEKLTDYQNDGVTLLNHPNPYMGRSKLGKITALHLDLAGDAYWHKVRSKAGKVIELWPLRPDRMTIVPSDTDFVAGYIYKIGDKTFALAEDDVIHFQETPNPLSDYYGMSRIEILAARIDLDVAQRALIAAFFNNAGVPFGMINIERKISTEEERKAIRQQFHRDFGGANAFRVGVIDGSTATYTAMGLPLGAAGVALPEVDEMNEARICAVFGVQPSLIATRLGMSSSSYANRVSDREFFWRQTQVPRYRDNDDTLTAALQPDFPDIIRFEHDLTKVHALQEDEDKKHARIRENWKAGLVVWQRAVEETGGDPEEEGMVLLMNTSVPTWTSDLTEKPEPVEEPPPPQPVPDEQVPQPAGRSNGVAH